MQDIMPTPKRGYFHMLPVIGIVCLLLVLCVSYFSYRYHQQQSWEYQHQQLTLEVTQTLERYHQEHQDYPITAGELLLFDPRLRTKGEFQLTLIYQGADLLPEIIIDLPDPKQSSHSSQ